MKSQFDHSQTFVMDPRHPKPPDSLPHRHSPLYDLENHVTIKRLKHALICYKDDGLGIYVIIDALRRWLALQFIRCTSRTHKHDLPICLSGHLRVAASLTGAQRGVILLSFSFAIHVLRLYVSDSISLTGILTGENIVQTIYVSYQAVLGWLSSRPGVLQRPPPTPEPEPFSTGQTQ